MSWIILLAQTFPTTARSQWTPEQETALWQTLIANFGPWLLGIAAIVTAIRSNSKASNSDTIAKESKDSTQSALNRVSTRLNTHEEIITNVAHNSPPPGSLMDIEEVKRRFKKSREEDDEKEEGC